MFSFCQFRRPCAVRDFARCPAGKSSIWRAALRALPVADEFAALVGGLIPSPQREQAANGAGCLGAYRKTRHEHEQSFKRKADDLAAQPSAQCKQAADGRGRLAYHQHRQDSKREATDRAS
jgi:hypothetical protein